MDTSSPDQARALVEMALESHGRLDILVNNAAIDAPPGNVWDLPDDEWERTIAVNLSGVFYCSRAALQPMLKAGSGCIVNLSSQSAPRSKRDVAGLQRQQWRLPGLTMAFSEQVATTRGLG